MATVLGAAVLICRRSTWSIGLAAGLFASFLIAPHTGTYDATMLLVPAWLIAFSAGKPAVRALAVAFFTPIPWLLQLLDPPWTGLPALVLFCLTLALAWEPAEAALRLALARRIPAAATGS